MVKVFYKKLHKNLNKNNIFYKHYDESFSYKDLRNFYLRFLNVISYLPNKRSKIFILSEKSFSLYAASISTVISDNIWIPVSQTLPKDRIFSMIELIKPDLFIIDNFHTLEKIKIKNFLKKKKINLITLEEIRESIPVKKYKFPEYKKENISMIFFTSGSSGIPKGVELTHASYIFSLMKQIKEIYGKNKQLVFGDYHDISFVISLNILFPCFYLGAQISPGINTRDILFPLEHVKKNKVNTIITVPTTISRIRYYYKKIDEKINLKFLVLCGEPFYFDLLKYIFQKKFSKNVFNAYGSTELSPWGFSYQCKLDDTIKFSKETVVPIGRPFKNVKVKIIDREIFIGGPLLSNGYINKKDNKKSFQTIDGKKFYKTNDIAIKKGDIYFIKGRKDSVVKLFGYRVDLFDIDSILRKYDRVSNCFIFLKDISENEKIIYAAVEGRKLNKNKIINKLRTKLPNYMIPKEVRIFNKFPVNKNNKLDRVTIKKMFD